MYFNTEKEDTNIDKEFKNKKKDINIDITKYKMPLIIAAVVILLILILIIVVVAIKNKTRYYIELNEPTEMTIYLNSEYNDPGYTAKDNKGNDLKDKINISGTVDNSKIGTYTISYSIGNTLKTRRVIVTERPENANHIVLHGKTTMELKVGDTYNEPGYSAVNIDTGDITDKVVVKTNLDTTKAGTYYITYTVTGQDNVTVSETRTIIVK